MNFDFMLKCYIYQTWEDYEVNWPVGDSFEKFEDSSMNYAS